MSEHKSFEPTVLLRSEDTGGEVAIVEVLVPPRWSGPPLHRHDFDEAFYVLDGELTFQLGDERSTATRPTSGTCGRSSAVMTRPRHHDQAQANVEDGLARLNLDEVPSDKVGELIMEQLRSRDYPAYVRYASVYRNFQDLDEFYEELKDLSAKQARAALSKSQVELPLK